jgi:hypothetical protein
MKKQWLFIILLGIYFTSCKQTLDEVDKTTSSTRLSAATTLTGTTYYVKPSGNDAYDGKSAATAWKTIERVNFATDANGNKVAQLYNPGDQILFEGGGTFPTTDGILIYNSSGTASNPIKISSYGTGKATISATKSGIYVKNQGYIWVDNLIIKSFWKYDTQSGNGQGFCGVAFNNFLPNRTQLGMGKVTNCDIYGFHTAGIAFLSDPKNTSGEADHSHSGYKDIIIEDNFVHDNGDYGIYVLGQKPQQPSELNYAFENVQINRNRVEGNLGLTDKTWSSSGNGILISDAGSGLIEKNVIYNNGWNNRCVDVGPAGLWCYDSKNLTFQFNEAYLNGTSAGTKDGHGMDLDGGVVNCIMQYNYTHDNYTAGYLVWEYGNERAHNKDNVIRYNVSVNDNTQNVAIGSIFIGGYDANDDIENLKVYNNTIYSPRQSCLSLEAGGARNGIYFYNNIFYATGQNADIVLIKTPQCWLFNNDYYNPTGFKINFNNTSYTSLATFRNNTANEKFNSVNYGSVANPLLANAPAISQTPSPYTVTAPTIASTTNGPNGLQKYSVLTSTSTMINNAYDLRNWSNSVGNRDFTGVTIPYNGAFDIGACEYRP